MGHRLGHREAAPQQVKLGERAAPPGPQQPPGGFAGRMRARVDRLVDLVQPDVVVFDQLVDAGVHARRDRAMGRQQQPVRQGADQLQRVEVVAQGQFGGCGSKPTTGVAAYPPLVLSTLAPGGPAAAAAAPPGNPDRSDLVLPRIAAPIRCWQQCLVR